MKYISFCTYSRTHRLELVVLKSRYRWKIDFSTLKMRSFLACRCFNVVSAQLQRRTDFQQQEFAFSTILFFNVTHRWKLIRKRPLKVRFLNAYAVEISVSQGGNWLWMFRFFNVKYANSLYYRPRTDLQRHNFRWKLVLNSSFRNIAH